MLRPPPNILQSLTCTDQTENQFTAEQNNIASWISIPEAAIYMPFLFWAILNAWFFVIKQRRYKTLPILVFYITTVVLIFAREVTAFANFRHFRTIYRSQDHVACLAKEFSIPVGSTGFIVGNCCKVI